MQMHTRCKLVSCPSGNITLDVCRNNSHHSPGLLYSFDSCNTVRGREEKLYVNVFSFNVLWATVKFQLIEPEEICWSLFGTLSNTEIIANRN